jgi:hypothetical protein
MPDQLAHAREVKDRIGAQLAGNSRVRGVGLTRRGDGFAIRVLVSDAETTSALALPAELDGVAIEVSPVGEIHAQE